MGWIDPRFNPNCATKYLLFICQRFGNIYHFDPQTRFTTGARVGSSEPTAGELGKEREMVEGLGTSLGTQPRVGEGLL